MGQAQDGDIDLWDIARLSLLRKQRQPYGTHLIGAQRCIHPKPQIRPAPTDRPCADHRKRRCTLCMRRRE